MILKRGRSKPFWVGHPWVFSGAVHRVEGPVGEMGGPCVVVDERDNVLGAGFYNPHAKIAVRILEHRRGTELDFTPSALPDLVRQRLSSAVARREMLGLPDEDTTAYRVCHGEGDLLGGLCLDRMGATAVMHLRSRAMYEQREMIASTVAELLGVTCVVAVVDEEASKSEAIPVGTEVLVGETTGPMEVREAGVRFRVDPDAGFKPSFHAAHRDNRARFSALCADQSVLDLYCGAGGFGLRASLAGAASVLAIDTSEPACAAARTNAELNRVSETMSVHCADAMVFLKEARAQGRTWSRIVCDPPRFARGRGHLKDAQKKLARLNTLALASLEPGGLMLTCTGSPHVSEEAFMRVLTDAGHRLRRGVHVHGVWGQAPDHPFAAVAPEGWALTAALVSLE
ncbi:MAG: class I SAM-dependent rRNA methyltransferase [Myxococcota bacterium]|nr:class I SAM-dependent rRNA methyltransferase [Myxococcota bacterium]